MLRKEFYITEEQQAFLEVLGEISVSEHIRRALDEYIERRKDKPSTSASKMKVYKEGKEVKEW